MLAGVPSFGPLPDAELGLVLVHNDNIRTYVCQMSVFANAGICPETTGPQIQQLTSLIASAVGLLSEESVCIPDG